MMYGCKIMVSLTLCHFLDYPVKSQVSQNFSNLCLNTSNITSYLSLYSLLSLLCYSAHSFHLLICAANTNGNNMQCIMLTMLFSNSLSYRVCTFIILTAAEYC